MKGLVELQAVEEESILAAAEVVHLPLSLIGQDARALEFLLRLKAPSAPFQFVLAHSAHTPDALSNQCRYQDD